MLWKHLKTNFRPQLSGVRSRKSSRILTDEIISSLVNLSNTLNLQFIYRKNPIEFLLDGVICDTATHPSGKFALPTNPCFGIEWEWDPQKWNEFIVHDLVKLFYFNAKRNVAIYLRDDAYNANARHDIEKTFQLSFPNGATQQHVDIIELERIKSKSAYTLDMHHLQYINNSINLVDTQKVF